MIQAWAALLSAAFVAAACWAAGTLLISRTGVALKPFERTPLAFITGASCIHLAVFTAMVLKIGYKPVWIVLLGGVILAAWFRKSPVERTAFQWSVPGI